MTITPVVPQLHDYYIETSQGILIDYTAAPVTVDVKVGTGAAVRVWDNVSGFQNSWTGNYINDGTYIRLVCDPPAAFTFGDTVEVTTATATESLTYDFKVGLERLTTEADVGRPQIIEASTYVWAARVHTNESTWPPGFDGKGNIYLQVLDPRGSEVITIPGNDVGLVYDVARNKVIIYFVRHGSVYYMEADPSDVPSTQSQLRSISESCNFGPAGAGDALVYADEAFPPLKQAVLEYFSFGPAGSGDELSYADAAFPPLKQAVLELFSLAAAGSGAAMTVTNSPYDSAPTPNIATGLLSQSTIKIRASRPTATLENSLLVGYYLVRFDYGVPSIIDYEQFVGDATFVEFEDLAPLAGVYYAVLPVYYKGTYDLGIISDFSNTGSQTPLKPNSVSEYMSFATAGSGTNMIWIDSSFPPIGP